MTQAHRLFDVMRCRAFVADVTTDDLTDTIAPDSVDFVTLIFVLSAIHPDNMLKTLQNIYRVSYVLHVLNNRSCLMS